MIQAKKSGSADFGDILAGLRGHEPAKAAPRDSFKPSSDRSPGPASTIDASWVKSAQARAKAAYMAQQAAKAPNETAAPRPARGAERTRASGPFSWDWRDFGARPAQNDADAAPRGSAGAAPPNGDEPFANGPVGNPVHALRRLLQQFPFAWRRMKTPGLADAAQEAPASSLRTAPPPMGEDEAIAEELGLSADLAIVDLRRIRRDFAKKNHPDRFAPAQRSGAARRMTIANMLIDERMKQRPPPK
ncbi:hypothetical protein Msil_1387 [Methylocella silvestris BL2]|uniref:J domain-containing protein n=1 Tax=Methylocella silvestris (strain DSM 15510 / CIP 108128 / LMG 27833 / NCIMB 13906 / BL2) TaxID=395965 RepID=B8ESL7_METSB|nr:hypothetical protein [Methylocella silvestris]ACK50352.1 hypothetical protein Msil_1387 [Methylocella silvestris BL2]